MEDSDFDSDFTRCTMRVMIKRVILHVLHDFEKRRYCGIRVI